jgi:DNA primase
VARVRGGPPRTRRTPPVGLERQIMKLLVAHPMLASDVDDMALRLMMQSAPDHAEMLEQLVLAGRELGPSANFASLAEVLRATGPDFDALIAEIAADTESDVDKAKLELAGAVRQTRLKALAGEKEKLAAQGLGSEEAKARYRELTVQEDQLRRQALAEVSQRD